MKYISTVCSFVHTIIFIDLGKLVREYLSEQNNQIRFPYVWEYHVLLKTVKQILGAK